MTTKMMTLLTLLLLLCTANAFAIPASYGVATHGTTAWQELASSDSQYGVSWSTDGSNWGRETLYVGQTVQFRFDLHKQNVGTHYADFLKAWLDWDYSGTFTEDDVIAYDYRTLATSESNNLGSDFAPNVPYFSFFSNSFEIMDAFVGDTWLRARVACSESIGSQSPNYDYEANFNPTGYYNQGEVEEWLITVAPVPEPSTIILLGSGLLGLGWFGRKRRK
jgi:hypothetical protein